MLQSRLVEERCHPRSASVLYDLSRSPEHPISASMETHTTMGCLRFCYVERDAICHFRADYDNSEAADTIYAVI